MGLQMHWEIILQHMHKCTCDNIILTPHKTDSFNSDLYVIIQYYPSLVLSELHSGTCTLS